MSPVYIERAVNVRAVYHHHYQKASLCQPVNSGCTDRHTPCPQQAERLLQNTDKKINNHRAVFSCDLTEADFNRHPKESLLCLSAEKNNAYHQVEMLQITHSKYKKTARAFLFKGLCLSQQHQRHPGACGMQTIKLTC